MDLKCNNFWKKKLLFFWPDYANNALYTLERERTGSCHFSPKGPKCTTGRGWDIRLGSPQSPLLAMSTGFSWHLPAQPGQGYRGTSGTSNCGVHEGIYAETRARETFLLVPLEKEAAQRSSAGSNREPQRPNTGGILHKRPYPMHTTLH